MNRIVQANYDRLSRWYDLFSSSEREITRKGICMLNPQPGESVLEIGMGTGHGLIEIAARAGTESHITGLDLSSGMLHRARINLTRNRVRTSIDLIQADAANMPFPAQTFDTILLSFTLELFPQPEIPHLLETCHTVLKPNGRLGVIALEACTPPGIVERIYTWMHQQWPVLIDCQPIPVVQVICQSGYKVQQEKHFSLWGIPTAIVIAQKAQSE